jgi:hypothetical protein
MPVSRPCDQCDKVKRVSMYGRAETGANQGILQSTAYLCRPCARELGYFVNPASVTVTGGPYHVTGIQEEDSK